MYTGVESDGWTSRRELERKEGAKKNEERALLNNCVIHSKLLGCVCLIQFGGEDSIASCERGGHSFDKYTYCTYIPVPLCRYSKEI